MSYFAPNAHIFDHKQCIIISFRFYLPNLTVLNIKTLADEFSLLTSVYSVVSMK